MYYTIDEYGYQYILEVLRAFFSGTWGQLILFLAACLVIWILGDKKLRGIFVYPVIFLVLTVYNPFVMNYVILKLNMEQRYYRYFWLLPLGFAISCALILIFEKVRKLPWKICAAAAALAVLILQGTSVQTAVTEKTNILKLGGDVLSIAEAIRTDSTSEEKKCLYIDSAMMPLRTYDASIQGVLSRTQLATWSIDVSDEAAVDRVIKRRPASYTLTMVMRYGLLVEEEVFESCIEECEVDYIIPLNSANLDTYFTQLGYVRIYNDNFHSVYRVNNN